MGPAPILTFLADRGPYIFVRVEVQAQLCRTALPDKIEESKITTDKQNNDFGRSGCGGIDAICCKSGNRASKIHEQSWGKLHGLHQAVYVK